MPRPGPPPRWRVVGGADKGGLVVRDGKALNSAVVGDRLSHGAVVTEISLEGARLHYRRISGDGPNEGWVSTTMQGKALLEKVIVSDALPADQVSGWDDRLLVEEYKAGGLNSLVREFHAVLRRQPNGPAVPDRDAPRTGGVGTPWAKWVPAAEAKGRPRLVCVGDSITHGPPMNVSTPWVAALAQRNPALSVENVGWGGIMSMSLLDPKAFGVPIPCPHDLGGQFIVIMVGTNDAMAITSLDPVVDTFYVADTGPENSACRLPQDWRTTCRPTVELFEQSLGALARGFTAQGARVAIATVPLLGEDLTDAFDAKQGLKQPPVAVCRELGSAVRRVASSEGCDILPVFECMEHRAGVLERPGIPWSPAAFGVRMAAVVAQQQHEPMPYEEIGVAKNRPELLFDLVHFNERGGALFAALCQKWMDSALASSL